MAHDLRLATTIRVEAGHGLLLPFHLDRFEASAIELEFQFERALLEEAIVVAAATWQDPKPARLRILIDRQGGWQMQPPQRLLLTKEPLRALLWPDRVLSQDPLRHHRTEPRPTYDAAQASARDYGFLDVIFVNELGMITEAATHNVFVRSGDRWKTPPLSAGVLPGVFRRHLLDTRPDIFQEDVSVAELIAAEEIWLTSATHGARKVSISV